MHSVSVLAMMLALVRIQMCIISQHQKHHLQPLKVLAATAEYHIDWTSIYVTLNLSLATTEPLAVVFVMSNI